MKSGFISWQSTKLKGNASWSCCDVLLSYPCPNTVTMTQPCHHREFVMLHKSNFFNKRELWHQQRCSQLVHGLDFKCSCARQYSTCRVFVFSDKLTSMCGSTCFSCGMVLGGNSCLQECSKSTHDLCTQLHNRGIQTAHTWGDHWGGQTAQQQHSKQLHPSKVKAHLIIKAT